MLVEVPLKRTWRIPHGEALSRESHRAASPLRGEVHLTDVKASVLLRLHIGVGHAVGHSIRVGQTIGVDEARRRLALAQTVSPDARVAMGSRSAGD